jgi:conjugal transfer pilus assembly protein TraD
VLITLSEGLWLSGERPTLQRLQAHLDDAGERLLQSHASSRFIQDESRQTAIRVALEQLVQHDRTHYQKMTSALMSLLSLLTTGPIGRCLSPDAEEFRPRWDIRRAIDQGVAVYVGLNCLAQPTVGAALARLIMADVAAFSSERLRQANARPLSLMVDEAGEIMSPALLQLLGKGRESSIHVLIAIQTLSDLAWHLGDQAASEVVQGNCGAWFLFRQLDALSREVSERRLGEIPLVEDASHEGMSRRQDGFFTQLTRSRGQSRSRVWRPRIPAALFAGFKDRECVAHFPDGSLWRLTVPLVEG